MLLSNLQLKLVALKSVCTTITTSTGKWLQTLADLMAPFLIYSHFKVSFHLQDLIFHNRNSELRFERYIYLSKNLIWIFWTFYFIYFCGRSALIYSKNKCIFILQLIIWSNNGRSSLTKVDKKRAPTTVNTKDKNGLTFT